MQPIKLIEKDRLASSMRGTSSVDSYNVSNQVNNEQVRSYPNNRVEENQRSRNVGLTLTFITVFIGFVVCCSTNQILFFQNNVGGYEYYGTAFGNFSVAMTTLNSAINLFIYVFRLKQYRNELKRIFCHHLGNKENQIIPIKSVLLLFRWSHFECNSVSQLQCERKKVMTAFSSLCG